MMIDYIDPVIDGNSLDLRGWTTNSRLIPDRSDRLRLAVRSYQSTSKERKNSDMNANSPRSGWLARAV